VKGRDRRGGELARELGYKKKINPTEGQKSFAVETSDRKKRLRLGGSKEAKKTKKGSDEKKARISNRTQSATERNILLTAGSDEK